MCSIAATAQYFRILCGNPFWTWPHFINYLQRKMQFKSMEGALTWMEHGPLEQETDNGSFAEQPSVSHEAG